MRQRDRDIYIYAVGGESGHLRVVIWSPRRFPLQNQAILLGEFVEIWLARNEGFSASRSPGSGDQIPSLAVSPKNALRKSHRKKHETTIFIVFSRILGPFFGNAPKTRKTHLAESATIWCGFGGGFFCTKFLFLFFLILSWLVFPTPT